MGFSGQLHNYKLFMEETLPWSSLAGLY